MSHFTVAVIHREDENVDELLAPFQENNMGDCPEGYLEFVVEIDKENSEQEIKKIREEHYEGDIRSDEEVMMDWSGYTKNENGDWGYVTNPNSEWDWYVIGGRWRGLLRLKEGATAFMEGENGINKDDVLEFNKADSAYIRDVNFEPTKEDIERFENNWLKHLERIEAKEEGYNPLWEYGIEKDETKEDYIKRLSTFSTFAILEDGEWESGGWSSDVSKGWQEDYTKRVKKWIAEKPDFVITIVDCHT